MAALPAGIARAARLVEQLLALARAAPGGPALAMLVRNLLDNPLRHDKAGGQVELSVSAVKERPTLTVDDDGLGIPRQDRERVFDCFYRRNPGAEQHGASISLGDSPRGGLRVSLTFA